MAQTEAALIADLLTGNDKLSDGKTSKEVTRYTKAASQRLRAVSALVKMTGTRT